MKYYITYGDFQRHLINHYKTTGKMYDPSSMITVLYEEGKLSTDIYEPDFNINNVDIDSMSESDFIQYIDKMYMNIHTAKRSNVVLENFLIPDKRDTFIIKHLEYAYNTLHQHDYFEINYVYRGKIVLNLENEDITLNSGDFCIITPHLMHNITMEPGTFAFEISIRKSTFDTTFFSLMSRDDLLSHFFRTVLQDSSHKNYLLFQTGNNKLLRKYIHILMFENRKSDIYSNSCCISIINLLFGELLRSYSDTAKVHSYNIAYDFSMLIKYIQDNYKTATLDSIAEYFSYSKQYLCTIIKKNTGLTFIELITKLKMSDAVNFLTNSNLNICEIADLVGYNSADHFSRTFKNTYGMSPKKYRQERENN